MQTPPRAEYVARINRVMDHVDGHLGDPLTLDELAGVAAFSPFYFHRIFAALVGETPAQYVRRLRVERAAQQLVAAPRKPITQVALDCGFSGSAPFARAFKETLGMSASEWRRTMGPRSCGGTNAPAGAQDRKDRQAPGKLRKDWVVTPAYGDAVQQRLIWRVTMTDQSTDAAQPADDSAEQPGGAAKRGLEARVEVKEVPAFTLAYVRHTGPYAGDTELFGRLFGKIMPWAGSRGLLGPQSRILAVYHDDPGLTEPDKLRVSVGVSVPDDTAVDGEIGKMVIPGGTWAVAGFELAEDEYPAAWDAVFSGWLPDSGYQPTDGACYEQYLNDPAQHPEHKCIVNICVPVRPL
jgi:AraC family transcriptional regulator